MKRVKRRYLLVQLNVESAPETKPFLDAVWRAVGQLYGEYGASQTGLALIEYDREGRMAILRSSLVAVDMVRTALASMGHLCGKAAAVHVLAVSGTIKSLRA